MPLYNWVVSGTAADGQTWTVEGKEEVVSEGAFLDLPALVMKRAFITLTTGRAVYGQPGVGCKGPYSTKMMMIEEAENGA
jgi:hypothetical protein